MNPRNLVLTLLCAGSVSLLVSYFWPKMVGGTNAYTKEDAAEFQQAGAELHALKSAEAEKKSNTKGHTHGATTSKTVEEAQRRFDAAKAKLEEAKNKGKRVAGIAKWVGVICLAAGVVAFLTVGRT